jgi:hypothetical protein
MRKALWLIAAALACLAGARPQDRPPRETLPVELVSKLRAEAARLEPEYVFDSFAALAKPDPGGPLSLSPEQAELVRRLDGTARAVLRAWLLRGLDQKPTPPAAELVDRLAGHGAKVREAVIAHAEAIARETILNPAQARNWGRAGAAIVGPLPGRYPELPLASDKPPETAADYDLVVRSRASKLNDSTFPASELFGIIIRNGSGPLGLSAEQLALTRRLDELARSVCRACLLRGIGETPPKGNVPPTHDLLDRLSQRGQRLRASAVAHAELLALGAVLDPDQAERARRLLWRERGVEALLDPELAARLRLSREQREQVIERLVNRREQLDEINVAALRFTHSTETEATQGGLDQAKIAAQVERQAHQELKLAAAEVDFIFLDILTPTQFRAVFRLLDKPAPSRPSTKAKKSRRHG